MNVLFLSILASTSQWVKRQNIDSHFWNDRLYDSSVSFILSSLAGAGSRISCLEKEKQTGSKGIGMARCEYCDSRPAMVFVGRTYVWILKIADASLRADLSLLRIMLLHGSRN